ncbi:AMP-dependent synthetase [Paenibacillus paeoniae]|uniref:AMP-dependent synthetase n=2 Tax=Paenibacillus paeoniae TaxID=2292705 RepID=A0A371PPQ9_9BACL|nr:AMP-dependent synthetase [Paenibacillus paeoniae]
MLKLAQVMRKMGMLSPLGLYRLFAAICRYGINVMALLRIAERTYGEAAALADDRETISYRQLLVHSEELSLTLKTLYGIKPGSRAALLCRNHASLVKSVFALSWAGADIYLLNAEMSQDQWQDLLTAYDFDLLIYDEELIFFIEQSSYNKGKLLSYHDEKPAVNNLRPSDPSNARHSWHRTSSGTIMLLTGGTTGKAKKVPHKPSLFHYLNPFHTLLERLHLVRYHTGYIATPIYHGYGIAILLLFVALGKKIVLTSGFDASRACALIRAHQVQVATVVPLMLDKMMKHNAEDLRSLACIASGGAELNPKLVAGVFAKLGDVLCNLYGTSESGLNIVAAPPDLRQSAHTLGRRIEGVPLFVLDEDLNETEPGVIGQFCIRNRSWRASRNRKWIATGDMGYMDSDGLYYLCGRVDDRIVSGGENVYPIELEHILIHHPLVEDVAVIGISDETFGQRLMAYVQLIPHAEVNTGQLMEWLRSRTARYQMPKEIVLAEEIPYTHLGKRDKKRLI